jgi:hypothetical protein
VCRLADMACGFILSFCVGVALGQRNKHNEQNRQGKSAHPDQAMSPLAFGNHRDFETPPVFSLYSAITSMASTESPVLSQRLTLLSDHLVQIGLEV